MSSQGSMDRLLDQVPGYGGYRDKERRRESDRLIREQIVREYHEQAGRLGLIARRLADDREIMSIRYVDAAYKQLNSFTARVRTASYGYSPLFSDRPVDAHALDQLAGFDRSLNDQIEPLSALIGELESLSPDSPEFRSKTEEIEALIIGLNERFDRRSEVIESGSALPDEKVAALLEAPKQLPVSPTSYNLHQGEALTRLGVNYSIVGRISITTTAGSWRDFQLEGGDGNSFFHVPASEDGEFQWLWRVALEGDPGDPAVSVGSTAYALSSKIAGTGEVIGSGGESDSRSMTHYRYDTASGGGVVNVYDWHTDYIALAGEQIDPLEVEIWSREGGRTV